MLKAMIVGVPKEIKESEYRVGLTPAGVAALKEAGIRVIVEKNAGAGSSIPDEEYARADAEILSASKEVFEKSDIIIKVKEPLPPEYPYLKDGLIIFTFFHLAAKKDLASALIEKNVTALAYETVEDKSGRLPILSPMSEVAGKLAVQAGAQFLTKPMGGRGVLLGGTTGVERGTVVILGAGDVGINAAMVSTGLGAHTVVLDISAEKLKRVEELFGSKVSTLFSNPYNIEKAAIEADLLVGAVHIPGGRTPLLVRKELVAKMKKGSVIVDVAVDQGGCVETIRPTTHANPIYEVDGVIHYGVTNMPGAVPRTSTFALTNATAPYLLKLAKSGLKKAVEGDRALFKGVNIHRGKVCHEKLAESLGLPYTPLSSFL